ncbi:glycine--tRNA ligase, partial [Candidatus Bathyarchaeota archaeon]|nr:glycine--tRNA ligase [Candidatus Bathyarchaeota archaeon]
MEKADKYEKVMELGRRRGFFWPSYEIYGGVGGFIDFGPVGVALKRKIENSWRDFFLRRHEFLEIETPIITPRKVFEASGHVEHFKDPVVECKGCGRKYRVDHVLAEAGVAEAESMSLSELDNMLRSRGVTCPECRGEFSEPKYVQTMFETTIGPYAEAIGYGRPEAAQGIFVNFKRVYEVGRGRFPIAIGQIGRAMRNEVSPRQGPIRLREFTIMEFEFFFDPEEPSCPLLSKVEDTEIRIIPIQSEGKRSEKPIQLTIREAIDKKIILMEWMAYFMALSHDFVSQLGIPMEKQRFEEKLPTERAHYSAQTFDQEVYLERWGWTEIAGHAYRTSYDISRHMEYSGVDMRVFRPYTQPIEVEEKRLIPVMEEIKKDFGENYAEVVHTVESKDPEEVEREFLEKGFLKVGKYTFFRRHFNIKRFKVKDAGKRIIPHVVEPSFGADRLTYAVMEYAYSTKNDRVILKIPKKIAPIQAVVL